MHGDCMILSMRFPQKLWRIVNECGSGAIGWSSTGTSILLDYKKFQKQYLDAAKPIFKTSNMTSFIRQLNLYGFRKVTAHNRDPGCNSHNPHVHEFLHESFQSGRPDLLMTVRRKTAGKPKDSPSEDSMITADDDPDEQEVQGGSNFATRLEMCRLELRRELQQITREYHKLQHEDGAEDSGADEVKRAKVCKYEDQESCWKKNRRIMHMKQYSRSAKVHEC